MSIDIWPARTSSDLNSYYPNSSSGNEINLREEFIKLIDGTSCDPQRGHWVLLKRISTRQRCSCWERVGEGEFQYSEDNRKYPEPDPRCTVCNGEGWIYKEELYKTRRRIITPPEGQGSMEKQTDFGLVNVPLIIYYFKNYVRPTEYDRIIEIDNNEDGSPLKPIVKRDTYSIITSEPFRDINGRIEYWRCATKKEELRFGESQ